MVTIVGSTRLREVLERELAAQGVIVDDDARWTLVERGHESALALDDGRIVVLFDAVDHMEVVRMLSSGMRETTSTTGRITGLRDDGAFAVIAVREIRVVEATADGIVVRSAAGRLRVRPTLQHLESSWSAVGFVRANRSQLVNLLHVAEIVPWFNSRLVLRLHGGDEVEVSKTYAKRLRGALGF